MSKGQRSGRLQIWRRIGWRRVHCVKVGQGWQRIPPFSPPWQNPSPTPNPPLKCVWRQTRKQMRSSVYWSMENLSGPLFFIIHTQYERNWWNGKWYNMCTYCFFRPLNILDKVSYSLIEKTFAFLKITRNKLFILSIDILQDPCT